MSLLKFKDHNYFKEHSWRQSQIELLPHRIQVLLAYTYAKKALLIFTKERSNDQRSQQALQATLNWINDPTKKNAQFAQNLAKAAAGDASYFISYAANAASYAANVSYVYNASYAAANVAYLGVSWEWLSQTFLHTKGPSFPFQNNWKTTDTISLAKTIWRDQDLSLMKILADALQDAGMQDETLLKHLQEDECELSDWTLTNLLGFHS